MPLDFHTAEQLYTQIKPTVGAGPVWREAHEELLRLAVRYARIRTDWALASIEERAQTDQTRTRAHDAFIEMCDILARAMGRSGADTSWRRELGDDRKRIGDFACHAHAILGIEAR